MDAQNRLSPDAAGVVRLVALGLAVVAAISWASIQWDARARVPVTVRAAPRTLVEVPLSDGSTVLLGGGSSLRYARQFGDVRRVAVVGTAAFRVHGDPSPFVVATASVTVTAMAARFDVRTSPGGTRVAVERGVVRVEPTGRPEAAVLLGTGDVREIRGGVGSEVPPDTSTAETPPAERRAAP